MSAEWVSIDELVRTLTDIFESVDTAIKEVESAIRSSTLRTARYPMHGPGDLFKKRTENAPEFWRGRKISHYRYRLSITESDGKTVDSDWALSAHVDDAIKIWPSVARENSLFATIKSANERTSSSTRRGVGGRPPEFDWEEILIEMARINHSEGLPTTQAEMTRRIQVWYAQNYNGLEPGVTELKKRVSKFFKAIRSET